MMPRWKWLALLLSRRLWFRASLISLLAVAAALLGFWLGPHIPSEVSTRVGADSVESILGIIASSMLAVTTFSLSTTVAAYTAATSNVTPRATKLLIEDTTTQNVLATFVGSFLYSLVAIITLSMDAYGDNGRLILFVTTIVVVLLIVVTLLRWIDYLLRLGRVGETIDAVERATIQAMKAYLAKPHLGGQLLADRDTGIPPGGHPILADRIGYVQRIDAATIARCARAWKGHVYIAVLPGSFVDAQRPLAWCFGFDAASDLSEIESAFMIADQRTFDQDPRFGLVVLAEIASRALSPAVNDPGTAIDVIGRAVRALTIWTKIARSAEPEFPELFVPGLKVDSLFDDIFSPIARDGAAMVEVAMRLQKALQALARMGDPTFAENARRHAQQALRRSEGEMRFDVDIERVRKAAAGLLG